MQGEVAGKEALGFCSSSNGKLTPGLALPLPSDPELCAEEAFLCIT